MTDTHDGYLSRTTTAREGPGSQKVRLPHVGLRKVPRVYLRARYPSRESTLCTARIAKNVRCGRAAAHRCLVVADTAVQIPSASSRPWSTSQRPATRKLIAIKVETMFSLMALNPRVVTKSCFASAHVYVWGTFDGASNSLAPAARAFFFVLQLYAQYVHPLVPLSRTALVTQPRVATLRANPAPVVPHSARVKRKDNALALWRSHPARLWR